MELNRPLTAEEVSHYRAHGYTILQETVPHAVLTALIQETGTLEQWEELPGKWMKYFERSEDVGAHRRLCRIENFYPYSEIWRKFMTSRHLLEVVAELMGEPAALFKEKINYKLPGGGGFAAHQDAPAFGVFNTTGHITLMVPLDPATPENGGIEMATGAPSGILEDTHPDGTLTDALVQSLTWTPLTLFPGDLLLFDSFIPHRSGPNESIRSRNAAFITYGRAKDGEFRDLYFEKKREAFPPECEWDGKTPREGPNPFNLGNPIR